jgi:hypothetical protein
MECTLTGLLKIFITKYCPHILFRSGDVAADEDAKNKTKEK